jgi:hypothetical protein
LSYEEEAISLTGDSGRNVLVECGSGQCELTVKIRVGLHPCEDEMHSYTNNNFRIRMPYFLAIPPAISYVSAINFVA